MNLVEQKEKYIKEREDLLKKREELLGQLKDVEVSVERYNGAIIAVNSMIEESNKDSGDKLNGITETPTIPLKENK